MKKIIGGRMYNSETAKKIDRWDNGYYGNDFRSCTEILYRKKTGEFFVHGWGGPMSKYAESVGNMKSGGEEITPLTEAEAKKWLEEHSDADLYIEVFGEPEE